MTEPERIYAAQRVATGIYLQPSNDGERWFLVASYVDGRDFGLVDGPKRATFWAWAPITGREFDNIINRAEDEDDALRELRYYALEYNICHLSKRDAISSALASSA